MGQFVIGQLNKPITLKLKFKSTNQIQSCNYVRACVRTLLCFWRLIAGRRCDGLKMFTSPL